MLLLLTPAGWAQNQRPNVAVVSVSALSSLVFQDYNRNGVQDTGEPGIANLPVYLFQKGIQRGQTTTNGNGQYTFNNSNVAVGVKPATNYEVRVLASDFPAGLMLTKYVTAGSVTSNTAQLIGGQAIVYVTTDGTGSISNAYGIGFAADSPDLSITTAATSLTTTRGGNATFTIAVSNQTTGTATNVIVRDTLDAGVTYVSSSPAATVNGQILTWNLGTLTGNQTAPVISLTVTATNPGITYNTVSVSTTDTEVNTRNNYSRASVSVPIKMCAGEAYVTSLSNDYTNVTWYRNGTQVSTGNSLTITQAGSYSFTSTTNAACPASGCSPIIVEDGVVPTLTISPAPAVVCAGQNINLTVAGCTASGSILWSTGATTATINVTPTVSANVYSVSCVSSTYGVCTSTASTTVTVNPLPVINLSSSTICAGQTATLTATAGYASYQFSTGLTQVGGNSGNTATYASTAGTAASTTTYSVTATTTSGCSATATGSITVNPLPVVTLSSTTICAGQTATLTASSGYASYQFSAGLTQVGGASGNTASLTSNASDPASTTTYSVTATTTSGCSATATGSITVNPLPVVTLSSTTICAGQTATLTASAGYASYQFSAGLTQVGGASGNTASLTSNASDPASTTTYSVTATTTSGCSATATGSITVNPLPVVTLSSTTICAGQTATLTASAGYASYQFSTGLTQVGGNSGNTATYASTAGTAASTTTYSVTATTTSGCSATATGSITVNPLPVVTLSSTTICAGQTATLTASSGYASYQFSAGLTQVGGNSGNTATYASTAGTAASTTTYSVTATTTSGCSATATGSITVNPRPTASVSVSSATLCQGQSQVITASGGTGYVWSTGATTASISVTATGVYSVTVTNATGCSDVTSSTITVNPTPQLTINTPTVCVGQSTTLTVGGCRGTLVWSTGDQTASLVINPSMTMAYSVTCTLSTGCSATATSTVTVNPTPTYTELPVVTAATCTGGTANNDAKISLTTLQNATRADLISGGSVVASATVTNNAVSFTGIANPTTKKTYTVRLYNSTGSSSACSTDVVVTLNPADCTCPAPKCVPVMITKLR